MQSRVHIGVLELFDEYDGDFGLLNERWARKEDQEKFSPEQLNILTRYVAQLEFSTVASLADELRAKVVDELDALESNIDDDVVAILKSRILP